MSLRRPHRDSWEQQERKRIDRSSSPATKQAASWVPIRRLTPSPLPSPLPSPSPSQQPQTQAQTQTQSIVLLSADNDVRPKTIHGYVAPYVADSPDEGDSDTDDYPEQLALTPTESRQDSVSRGTSPDLAEPLPTVLSSDEHDQRDCSPSTEDQDYTLPRLVYQPPSLNPDSSSQVENNNIIPSIETDPLATLHSSWSSTTATPSLARHASPAATMTPIEQHEFDMLHSTDFPVQYLRPVPDFIVLMTQVAPVIGDPGSAYTPFGPKGPAKPIFVDTQTMWLRQAYPEDGRDSVLKEERVGTRNDRLRWARKPRSRNELSSGGRNSRSTARDSSYGSGGIPYADPASSVRASWKGRHWSVNPDAKTRHLSFEVLERKISHGELLKLNLNGDAYRDAILIGGGPQDIGHSLVIDRSGATEKSPSPDNNKHLSVQSQQPSLLPSDISRPRSTDTSRSRSRDRARHSSMTTTTLHASRMSSSARYSSHATTHNSLATTSENNNKYDDKGRRWRAQNLDNSFGTGRYGIGGMMLWRLVKVIAKVEDGGLGVHGFERQSQEQAAWYCVPDRAMGGWF
ncbi:hypothetical protein LTR05_007322 [Lithohypha guttulata]|uniref:Uncharacterized protein n=1 Tax=Lithohypha guttulata TaxID=1690604 RepID=A0AAN7YDV7_9EURO|nr:hypothetical protein LTR05_007322 [Lithohypha guttulata]